MAWAKEGTLKPITEAESIISLAVHLWVFSAKSWIIQTKECTRNVNFRFDYTVLRPFALGCQYIATV